MGYLQLGCRGSTGSVLERSASWKKPFGSTATPEVRPHHKCPSRGDLARRPSLERTGERTQDGMTRRLQT